MAFDLNALQVFAQVPGSASGTVRALASYSTNDTAIDVETAGYFNSAAGYIPLGSQIFVAGDLDGTPFQKQYVVASNDGSTVAITPQANITFTATYMLTVEIPDVSTANERYVVAPIAGTVTAVYTTLGGALSGDDATITVKDGDGNSMGTITVAHSGSAAGDVDSKTTGFSNATVTAGEAIEVETDGGSTGTEPLVVSIVIAPS